MVHNALDVGTVRPDNQRGNQQGKQGGRAEVENVKIEKQHGVKRHADDRAERYEARGGNDADKQHQQNQEQKGIEHGDCQRGRGNALATLEAVEAGEHMAENGKEGRHIGGGGGDKGQLMAADKAGDKNAEHTLEAVQQKRGHCRPCAVGAQHIGSACVAAAVLADIITEKDARDNDSPVDAAQQVGGNGTEDKADDPQCGCGVALQREAFNEVGNQSVFERHINAPEDKIHRFLLYGGNLLAYYSILSAD